MQQQIRIFTFVAIYFSVVNLSLSQGTLQATLLPASPDGSPLSAHVIIKTPHTNRSAPFFTVSFVIIVNSNEPIFTVGRIAGGSTAWVFDLDAPKIADGKMIYTGTTDMGAFQIDDMLANRTDFELYSYPAAGGDYEIAGSLNAVPKRQNSYQSGIIGLVEGTNIWNTIEVSNGRNSIHVPIDVDGSFEMDLKPGRYVLTPYFFPAHVPRHPFFNFISSGTSIPVIVTRHQFTFVEIPVSELPFPPTGFPVHHGPHPIP